MVLLLASSLDARNAVNRAGYVGLMEEERNARQLSAVKLRFQTVFVGPTEEANGVAFKLANVQRTKEHKITAKRITNRSIRLRNR